MSKPCTTPLSSGKPSATFSTTEHTQVTCVLSFSHAGSRPLFPVLVDASRQTRYTLATPHDVRAERRGHLALFLKIHHQPEGAKPHETQSSVSVQASCEGGWHEPDVRRGSASRPRAAGDAVPGGRPCSPAGADAVPAGQPQLIPARRAVYLVRRVQGTVRVTVTLAVRVTGRVRVRVVSSPSCCIGLIQTYHGAVLGHTQQGSPSEAVHDTGTAGGDEHRAQGDRDVLRASLRLRTCPASVLSCPLVPQGRT